MVGIPGYIGAKVHRIPFVFEVRDLCPEGEVIMGFLRKGSLVERSLGVLERFLYRVADRICVVSPGFKTRLVERGYDPDLIRTVLLGADKELFEVPEDMEFRRQYGLESKTIAVYAGSHGRTYGLSYILKAAEKLQDRSDIAIVLIGDGNQKSLLLAQAKEMGLTNVTFIGFMAKQDLSKILAVCDIGLIILHDVGQRPVCPNKVFDYFCSGLPIIINFPGPAWDLIQKEGAGLYAAPDNPAELAVRIRQLVDDPVRIQSIAAAARQAGLKYDRKIIAEQLAEVFQDVLSTA